MLLPRLLLPLLRLPAVVLMWVDAEMFNSVSFSLSRPRFAFLEATLSLPLCVCVVCVGLWGLYLASEQRTTSAVGSQRIFETDIIVF